MSKNGELICNEINGKSVDDRIVQESTGAIHAFLPANNVENGVLI